MILRSTQPLKNEYQEFSLEYKGGRCVRLTTLPLSCSDSLKILDASTSWNPRSLSRSGQGQLYLI
jgi:hypothetical protein